MKAQQLFAALGAAKRITERAKEIDGDRARVEAGGYVEILLGSDIGQALVQHWARDIQGKVRVAEEKHGRVAARFRQLRDILVSAYSLAPASEDRERRMNCLEALDEELRTEEFQPGNAEIDSVSMMQERFRDYVAVVEDCLSLRGHHGVTMDLRAVVSVLREAYQTGDLPSTGVRAIIRSLSEKRQGLTGLRESSSVDTELSAAVEALISAPLDNLDDIMEWVLELHPRLSTVDARRNLQRLGLAPHHEILMLLGGMEAIVDRKNALASIERHPWYSFVRLLTLSRYSGYDLRPSGEGVLAGVLRWVKRCSVDDVHAVQLLLELEKVHLHVLLDIDHGRAIQADLIRYRQRSEWYDTSLASMLDGAETVGDKLVTREKVAVQHLATWLFDQGYTPVSQALGRGETDLQGVDPRGAFVIEAKIVTEATLRKSQEAMDVVCRGWANQALAYAEGLGLDRAYIVVFNRTASSQLIAGEPAVIGRVSLHFEVISVTEKTPSKIHGQTLTLRWTPQSAASTGTEV